MIADELMELLGLRSGRKRGYCAHALEKFCHAVNLSKKVFFVPDCGKQLLVTSTILFLRDRVIIEAAREETNRPNGGRRFERNENMMRTERAIGAPGDEAEFSGSGIVVDETVVQVAGETVPVIDEALDRPKGNKRINVQDAIQFR